MLKIGKRIDLTKGAPWKVILLFSIPVILSNILATIFSSVDSIIIGQFIPNNFAGVSDTGSIQFIFTQFASGIATGFSSFISYSRAQNDHDGIKKCFGHSITLGIIIGLILTVAAILCIEPLLSLVELNSIDEVTYLSGKTYLYVIFSGLIFIVLDSIIVYQLRGVGDSFTPLIIMTLANVFNAILTFLLVAFLPGQYNKVLGAAVASIASQALSFFAILIYSRKKYRYLRLSLKDLKIEKTLTKKLLYDSLPLAFQFSILGIGLIILQRSIVSFDSGVINEVTGEAAHFVQDGRGVASRFQGILNVVYNGFAISMLTFVAQNNGAGETGRIRKGLKQIFLVYFLIYIAINILAFIFSVDGAFVKIFLKKEAVFEETIKYANIFLFVFCGFSYFHMLVLTFRNCLQAIDKPMLPFIGGFLELAARLFICIVLKEIVCNGDPHSIMGIFTVALADPFAWILNVIIMAFGIKKYFFSSNTKKEERALVTDE